MVVPDTSSSFQVTIPFCAFNGGNDVWVDVVRALAWIWIWHPFGKPHRLHGWRHGVSRLCGWEVVQ